MQEGPFTRSVASKVWYAVLCQVPVPWVLCKQRVEPSAHTLLL